MLYAKSDVHKSVRTVRNVDSLILKLKKSVEELRIKRYARRSAGSLEGCLNPVFNSSH